MSTNYPSTRRFGAHVGLKLEDGALAATSAAASTTARGPRQSCTATPLCRTFLERNFKFRTARAFRVRCL
ncbi:unnamed protein product, partial [Iphiclides podalirius]